MRAWRTREIVIAAAVVIIVMLLRIPLHRDSGATTADIQAVRAECATAGAHLDHPVMATVFVRKGGVVGAAMPGDRVGDLFCEPWGSGH